ncbi:PaaI family thioesterase [Pantoea sp. 18069]|uniref:PaaI family thioesterase n=1 Tax=Pantoea sp. 18069 TaxID=2681415 RepID=UPI0013599333|nr:PaaI family thioesterase [Pantoea sp. 18069]
MDPLSQGWKPHELPGFMGLAGPLWSRREDAGWAYGLQVASQHLNPAGMLHGGALLTLMDHALSTIAWQAAQRTPCLTLQLDSHFLASVGEGGFVEVRAQVTQRTRSLIFLQGLATQAGAPVLQAQAIMKVVAQRGVP